MNVKYVPNKKPDKKRGSSKEPVPRTFGSRIFRKKEKSDLEKAIESAYEEAARSARLEFADIRKTRGGLRQQLANLYANPAGQGQAAQPVQANAQRDVKKMLADVIYDMGESYDTALDLLRTVKRYVQDRR